MDYINSSYSFGLTGTNFQVRIIGSLGRIANGRYDAIFLYIMKKDVLSLWLYFSCICLCTGQSVSMKEIFKTNNLVELFVALHTHFEKLGYTVNGCSHNN